MAICNGKSVNPSPVDGLQLPRWVAIGLKTVGLTVRTALKRPRFRISPQHIYTYALRGVLTSVLQESQGLTTYAFVMLLLGMVCLHKLTFRLMVTMVAEFQPLVIFIHNTMQGEIT